MIRKTKDNYRKLIETKEVSRWSQCVKTFQNYKHLNHLAHGGMYHPRIPKAQVCRNLAKAERPEKRMHRG